MSTSRWTRRGGADGPGAANKALVDRYQDALHHPETLDDVLAADFIAYDLLEGQRDRAALKRFRERVNELMPDQTVVEDYIVAEGDLVATHLTGTQTLPNGERVVTCLMEIVGINEGRIAWRRVTYDDALHALRQRVSSGPGRAS